MFEVEHDCVKGCALHRAISKAVELLTHVQTAGCGLVHTDWIKELVDDILMPAISAQALEREKKREAVVEAARWWAEVNGCVLPARIRAARFLCWCNARDELHATNHRAESDFWAALAALEES